MIRADDFYNAPSLLQSVVLLPDVQQMTEAVNGSPQSLATYRAMEYASKEADRIVMVNHMVGTMTAARLFAVNHLADLRAPHHTVSELGMMGELALAATGVLVLLEAQEFRKSVMLRALSVLRQMPSKARPITVLQYPPDHDERMMLRVKR